MSSNQNKQIEDEDEKFYHSNGHLKKHSFYSIEKQAMCHKSWYANGQLEELVFNNYQNGRLDRECKAWYENGQIMLHRSYRNGKSEVEGRWWYENGNPWKSIFFRNGSFDGERRIWDANSRLKDWEFYREGFLIDPSFTWKKKQGFLRIKKLLRTRIGCTNMLLSDLAKIVYKFTSV